MDAGAVAPLLCTFAMGIPELAGHLAAAQGSDDGETAVAVEADDPQRHLHGCVDHHVTGVLQ